MELKSAPPRVSYTKQQASEATGLPMPTIGLAIRDGELPAIRSGRRWVVLHEDLVDWLRRAKARGSIPSPVSDADRENLAELNRQRRARARASLAEPR